MFLLKGIDLYDRLIVRPHCGLKELPERFRVFTVFLGVMKELSFGFSNGPKRDISSLFVLLPHFKGI